MKISPMTSSGLTLGTVTTGADAPSAVQKMRSLKMTTQATPGQVEPPEEVKEAEQTAETTITEQPAATEVTEPLSPQFAALAKQRRALQVKEREIADREKALTEKTAASPVGIDVARLKSDPLGVLLENGVSYDQMTQAILDQQNGVTPQLTALQNKIKALEENFDKKLTDKDEQTKQQALTEMRKEATLLSAQGEEFALVRETKSIPTVVKLIESTYNETGEVLDVHEALALVENQLLKETETLARLQKVQTKLTPETPAPTQTVQPPRQMKTLTNRDTASVPMSRKARALAAFNGTLKT